MDLLSWTTEDEKAYVDYLFTNGRTKGDFSTLLRYPASIANRTWDPTVDTEEVRLYANRRVSDAKLLQGRVQ